MNATVLPLADYEIGKLIHHSDRTLVYRGRRKQDSQPIVIKLMRNEYPSFQELVQFRNQYIITRNLDIEGIVKPYALERYENRYALIMEDFGGISLDEAIRNGQSSPTTIPQFLQIAIQLAESLHHLHQKRAIHKDIKPANILIHPETGQVKLIDFSISSLLPKETQTLQTPNSLEGTLAYISPEQTGRMNRGIDYRSDFYSLGVTFYELLSGKLPFESDDPLELVHCHIAKIPAPLANQGDIPKVMASLVMKLMAKNAEDRYQSALGLKYDLEKCLRLWQETGTIEWFELGERDRSDRFLIPEKLYGREAEVQTLLAAFHRVANPPQLPQQEASQTEMMLVAGFSGIGKTAVINEVHKPIVRQRGYFIKGKFDQFQRNIPFNAFVQAFRDLMGQLLAESDAQLATWKAKILKALGDNGQVIIEVIPELEQIIGPQLPVPELSGSAAQNRFNRLFQKFIQVFTTAEHPLVIFIDDLQWADAASLNLMQLLMADSGTGYLLLLGAYRDNEVFPAHPLMLALDEIGKSGATLNTITLTPLKEADFNRLVADTLSCELEVALPLTELIHRKTKGNPFFATQFIKGLYEDGWISFNRDLSYWQCEISQVRQLALTDDVVEFMATRLHKLAEKTQEVLKLAACIGNQFDLATLAMVYEQPVVEVATALWGALQERFVLPISDSYKFFQEINYQEQEQSENVWVSYKFLHDRVQQAAYSLIDEKLKPETHLRIGRLLLSNRSGSAIEETIFDVTNQLNMGHSLISDRLEKDELARLNLMAGRKAKSSTAYLAAIDYFQLGIQLLDDGWNREYDLMLSLYLEAIESKYISTHFESSKTLSDLALKQVNCILDRLKIHELQIHYYIAKNERKQAVNLGIYALSLVNIELDGISPKVVNIEALADLPEMTEPTQIAALQILIAIVSAAVIVSPDLLVPIAFKMVNICLHFGNSKRAAYAYGFHGWMLCGSLGKIETGYQFGKLAVQLVEKFNAKEIHCKVHQQFNTFVRHRKEPLENLKELVKAVQVGIEVGDIEYACYSAQIYCILQFFLGQDLELSLQEQKKYLELIRHSKLEFQLSFTSPWVQLISNLLGQSLDRYSLIGNFFDETVKIPILEEANDCISLFPLLFIKTYLNYLFGCYDLAAKNAISAERVRAGSNGFIYYPAYLFYFSLALLACTSRSLSEERQQLIERVDRNQKQLECWMNDAPFTYQHKYDLVRAEYSRVLGQNYKAMELYDRAIAGAKENGYIQEEALANELAAKFYLDWGKQMVAAGYMQEAYYGYSRWGAKAKVEDLKTRYPTLLALILERQKFSSISSSKAIATLTKGTISKTTTGTGELLDLATLMKASRTLSQEISLEGTIANLMQVVRENAGAETIALMLLKEQVLMLAVKVKGEEVPKLDPIPVENSNAVPLSIVNKVKHGQQPLLLENASSEVVYAVDAYIQQHQPQSILCLPLIVRAASLKENRGQLIGILYLENNQVTGAFTSDRLEIINLLCSQAAIALENARLYQQAQQALTDLQQAQLQLVQNEKMATLGNLVAGVAHEINNPVGFIGGNINAAQEYLHELLNALSIYQQHANLPESVASELADSDLNFIAEDFPKLMTSMRSGVERIRHISISLRSFSRTDTEKKTEFNLHEGLDSTLLILKYRLKANEQRPAIEIIKEYGELPELQCYPGQLNQVFMNLLGNAIDALEESNARLSYQEIEKNPNRICLQTEKKEGRIIVRISDNGKGMTEEIKARIFEQGFTTKPVGKGTGLGMAIARQIVEEKHGGAIACLSELGNGTEFIVSLPLD